MKFPDFFIVGAPKCGTSSLAYYLRQHPQIFMPKDEVHFLSQDFQIARKVCTWEQYASLFESAPTDSVIGEKSVSYIYSRRALEEIKKYNPNAKIIIILRNPIDMMYSLYLHLLRAGVETAKSFEEALALEIYRLKGIKIPKGAFSTDLLFYRRLSHYYQYVKRYIIEFPSSQVFVIIFEDFFKDVRNNLKNVFRFLDVDPNYTLPHYPIQNVGREVKSPLLYASYMAVFSRLPRLIFGKHYARIFHQQLGTKIKQVRNRIAGSMLTDVKTKHISKELRANLEGEFLPEAPALSGITNKDVVQLWFNKNAG